MTTGRVEAKYTNPSSADVTLTPANYSSGQTVSLAAGSYFHTAAGGVSGGLATWQTALNAACNGYARTAASAATMLGYGNFTSGAAWGFDIASGNDTGLFGGVTFTAGGSPTYGITGPASAGDKAVSYADGTASAWTAGDVYDVTAADDLIVAWVAKLPTSQPAAARAVVSKRNAGAGWWLRIDSALGYSLRTNGTSGTGPGAVTVDKWHVGIGCIDRSTGKIRSGIEYLDDGTQAIAAEVAIGAVNESNSENLRLGQGATLSASGLQIAALYVVSGSGVATGLSANLSTALTNFANAINSTYSVALSTDDGRVTIANSFWDYSLTWTSTTLRDLLGFDADIASMQTATGAAAARGVWIPGCTFDLAGDPRMAPKVTDKRSTESPTGVTLSLRSTHKLEHNRLQWSHVTVDHVRESSATYAHGSWEWFLDETQFGLGSSWFPVGSLIQIYDHVGNRVGEDADVAGWAMHGVHSFEDSASLVLPGYTGLWDIHIPRIVAKGG